MLIRNDTKIDEVDYKDPNPKVFGPTHWALLHTYAGKNPYTKEWLDKFTEKIPCEECYNHFKKIEHPKNGENFGIWAYKTHDAVNKRLGKESPDMKEVVTFYLS